MKDAWVLPTQIAVGITAGTFLTGLVQRIVHLIFG
jgi:hypothetical protein